jgi:hypothetical protein
MCFGGGGSVADAVFGQCWILNYVIFVLYLNSDLFFVHFDFVFYANVSFILKIRTVLLIMVAVYIGGGGGICRNKYTHGDNF